MKLFPTTFSPFGSTKKEYLMNSEKNTQASKEGASDLFATLLITAVIFAIAGIPTWIFVFARFVLSPEGFWQNLVMYGVGIWFLGFFQIVLAVIGVVLIFFLWASSGGENKGKKIDARLINSKVEK